MRPRDGSTVLFQGTVENRIKVFRYESAQEDPQRWDGGSLSANSAYYLVYPAGQTATGKTLKAAFTDFCFADDSYQRPFYLSTGNSLRMDTFEIKNCRFYNGYNHIRGDTGYNHDLINNLFVRGYAYFYYRANLELYNNLFFASSLYFSQSVSSSAWVVQDNMFDNIAIFGNTWSGSHTVDYNGYANGSPFYLKGSLQTHDVEDDITFTSGAFGDYYQPDATVGNDFLNAGSRSASAAALAQYSVLDDTSKDTGMVDIGFHYVAADGNGVPLDDASNGFQGVPDYLEDIDGDGSVTDDTFDPETDYWPFWVDDGATAQELAEWLSAPFGSVSTSPAPSFTGNSLARGFYGGGASVGLPSWFDTGVILSTGKVAEAVKLNENYETPDPDDGDVTTDFPSVAGDSHLNAVLDELEEFDPGTFITQDAAVLQFKLDPFASGTLQFDLIFTSEEYPEFSENLINDAVAIFVNTDASGGGFNFDAGDNVALVHYVALSQDDPICIFTINFGDPEEEDDGRNEEYYQDNPAMPDDVFLLPYDGATTTTSNPWITTESFSISQGTPVFVKIVIADDLDGKLDSAVFIKPRMAICN